MLNFQYKGISQGKYVEGEIEAINNAEAAHKLKEQKVIITKLTQFKKKKKETKKKTTSSSDLADQIKELKQLLDDGIITKEEFTKAKKKLLD